MHGGAGAKSAAHPHGGSGTPRRGELRRVDVLRVRRHRTSDRILGCNSHRHPRVGLLEASEGRSITTVERVLLWCFHYDPIGRKYVLVARQVAPPVDDDAPGIMVVGRRHRPRLRAIGLMCPFDRGGDPGQDL